MTTAQVKLRTHMKYFFIVSGGDGFPLHGAYANRIMSMSKGLAQLEGVVLEHWYIILGHRNLNSQSGIYDGIPYRYSIKPSYKLSKFNKPFLHLSGAYLTAFQLLIQPNSGNMVVIACTHGLLLNPLWWICKLRKIPVIREINEFPQKLINKGESRLSFYDRLHIQACLGSFSGFIAISNRLASYLQRLFPDKPVLILPINVQPERFNNTEVTTLKYITYVGALSNYKDGLDILIHAFKTIEDSDPQLRLRLVGTYPSLVDKHAIESLISKLDLADKIELTGQLDRNDVTRYITEAHVLVLPRPDSIQAQGGFPTKLGEYLATGIPVVATSVGDIPIYLKDGENAYLAKPGSVDDLVRQISAVLSDYETAKLIASKGRLLAFSVFDYRVQATEINNFVKHLTGIA